MVSLEDMFGRAVAGRNEIAAWDFQNIPVSILVKGFLWRDRGLLSEAEVNRAQRNMRRKTERNIVPLGTDDLSYDSGFCKISADRVKKPEQRLWFHTMYGARTALIENSNQKYLYIQ
ncbi:hypothetical protein GJ744_004784 [Endocarpon pusillum]|uniref:Uncharacterized protein n=1 Tax=Endocarpon pusillum TaxID=364733 RepID=A0A8H7A5G6_9EURO|nr:hypothetical protein GJ744_004784 [Endocarpon pusillum]